MSFRPSSLCTVAATGHTGSHGAVSHCMQGIGWLNVADGATGSPSEEVSTRSQCLVRLRPICVLPTTGMLFSATHAMMQALQPVQAFRSIAMPHLWLLYSCSG